jgi:osmotically-inducible protein OsmY
MSAADFGAPKEQSLEPIVIEAKRLPQPVSDEILQRQVATALHDDPFFYDAHVSVTVRNGVVRLEGKVFWDGDMDAAKRIIRSKVPGVRRIVNELELCSCNGGG